MIDMNKTTVAELTALAEQHDHNKERWYNHDRMEFAVKVQGLYLCSYGLTTNRNHATLRTRDDALKMIRRMERSGGVSAQIDWIEQ